MSKNETTRKYETTNKEGLKDVKPVAARKKAIRILVRLYNQTLEANANMVMVRHEGDLRSSVWEVSFTKQFAILLCDEQPYGTFSHGETLEKLEGMIATAQSNLSMKLDNLIAATGTVELDEAAE